MINDVVFARDIASENLLRRGGSAGDFKQSAQAFLELRNALVRKATALD